MDAAVFQKREAYSKLFLSALTLVGWFVIFKGVFSFQGTDDPIVFALLLIFLFVSEYYPMPVWKGFTAINFPIVFVLYLLYGFPDTAVFYALTVLAVNILHRRPLRTILFNPSQLVLSLFVSVGIVEVLAPWVLATIDHATTRGIMEYTFLLGMFMIVNNTIVDLVLLIRPQRYSFKMWKHKTMTELNSACISLIYGILLFLLGSQNRGGIDVFSYFFFFSPLVGLALLSSTIARLKRERKRLKALFSITTELNRMLPDQEWLSTLKKRFSEFITAEASILWIKEDGEWRRSFHDGRIHPGLELEAQVMERFDDVKKPVIYNDIIKESGGAEPCFDQELKAYVYSPLVVESETVGMFVVARSRTKSFEDDDVQSIATLSNQLAAILKTRMLFFEKEKRLLLEERNRIARDIHDGIAQTLAGEVMKLEAATKKFSSDPSEAVRIVERSVSCLRGSLKEVRESIYALRPYPTERVGLGTAIAKKIDTIKQEYSQEISFEKRGAECKLDPMVEKVLFDTFQESVQNSLKHSKALRIDILLSYQTEHVLLKIKDNGTGFSLFQAMLKARNQPHFGILQMNDAADKIDASLQIDSKEGVGTEVTLTVPKIGFEGGTTIDQAHVSG